MRSNLKSLIDLNMKAVDQVNQQSEQAERVMSNILDKSFPIGSDGRASMMEMKANLSSIMSCKERRDVDEVQEIRSKLEKQFDELKSKK